MNPASGSVLLIDDDAALGHSWSLLLRHAGHRCDYARDVATATELYRLHRYQAVITDVNMPEVDGIAFMATLLKDRPVPVIVITGNPTVQAALAAIRISVIAFLVKPFPAATLLAAVDRALVAERVNAHVAVSLERIETWRAEMLAFESLLQGEAQPTHVATTLVALTARHLMDGMAELRLQISALGTPAMTTDPAAVAALNATKPVVMLEAIRDTIAVLDRTKDAFRSRELGELRKRLEILLRDDNSGDSPQVAPTSHR